jgi:hypothetical protein
MLLVTMTLYNNQKRAPEEVVKINVVLDAVCEVSGKWY